MAISATYPQPTGAISANLASTNYSDQPAPPSPSEKTFYQLAFHPINKSDIQTPDYQLNLSQYVKPQQTIVNNLIKEGQDGSCTIMFAI